MHHIKFIHTPPPSLTEIPIGGVESIVTSVVIAVEERDCPPMIYILRTFT